MINNTFIHKSNTMMKHQHGDLFFMFFYSQIPQNFFAASSLRSSAAKLPTLAGRQLPTIVSPHRASPFGSGASPGASSSARRGRPKGRPHHHAPLGEQISFRFS